jgi:hypothetical protein
VILESVSSDNLLLLRYELIQSASVEGVDHWLNGERPSHGTLVQLRRVSRFPQGISPEIARALFQAYHDSTFTVVLPP